MSITFHRNTCTQCGKQFDSPRFETICVGCAFTKGQPMTTPHKHAEFIKAWADGAVIQCKHAITGEWRDLDTPYWDSSEYRIKPKEKVVRWLWVYKNSSNIWRISTRYLTEHEAAAFYGECKKLDFTEMEFDK